MSLQIKQLSGDDVPKAWRPTWAVCWVVELDGTVVGGPYNDEQQARAVAEGREPPRLLQTPAP
ncbi:hypothetical protein [Pseudomonas oligotrophica]|uniref:hypothetical protein n=1 Tax=Pseudomonas oligotrophica TaxID=2912055 RepID=UPI001F299D18|nr:hypothetical protein [Pseudomonas oligotrophica]MCF7203102.1 hypothetical protein [Pseudomonas oligotrophica]